MSARPSLLLVPPTIALVLAGCTANVSSISPTQVAAAGPAFKMTVLGSGFSSGSTVQWNGSARSTTYVSATELLAQINQTDIASTGSASITVDNGGVAGGSSNTTTSGTSNAKTIDIVAQSIDATAYQIDPPHDGAVTFSSVSFPSGNGSAWSVSLGAGTPSNVVIAHGKVFLTTGTSSGSQLLALNQTNGAAAWGPTAIAGLTGGSAGVAYDDGQVFVAEAGFGSSTVNAYNANTGALAWSTPLAASTGAPTAADGFVYAVATGNSTLYALNETTGAIAWQQPLSLAGGTPAVTADGVYITSTSTGCSTTDFRPATGEVIWTSSDGSSFCPQTADATPAVANQSVYSPDSSGAAIFPAETGGSPGTLSYSPPGAFTTSQAFLSRSPNLDAISLSDDTVQWTFNGDNGLDVPPILVTDQTGNKQYVVTGSSLGNVYAISAASGSTAWTATVSGKVEQLAAGDGLLLVISETSGGGTLTAYTLSSNP